MILERVIECPTEYSIPRRRFHSGELVFRLSPALIAAIAKITDSFLELYNGYIVVFSCCVISSYLSNHV